MDGETEYASCAITANFSSNFCTSCHLCCSPFTSHFSPASGLHAFLLLIRPFMLDRVTKHLLKAPRANVTDFSIGAVLRLSVGATAQLVCPHQPQTSLFSECALSAS